MIEPVGIILAGGRGTRMGGVAKAGLTLGKKSLLDHAIARLAPQVAALAVNANDTLDINLPVLADTIGRSAGPLAGVLAGLDWTAGQGASHVVTVAVDTPFFPCDLVPHLLMAAEAHPEGFAIARTSDGLQGTFGIWPVALRPQLQAFLNDGHRKVRMFAEQHSAAHAPFPDTTPPSFFNINTPEDLAQAKRLVTET